MGQHAAARPHRSASGEDRPGAAPVVVLVAPLLARRDVEPAAMRSAGRCRSAASIYTVVGVLSPDIEFGNIAEVDVWLPLAPRSARAARRAQSALPRAVEGRRVTFEQAAAEMASIGAALATEHPRRPTAAGRCGSCRVANSPAEKGSGW